ncbi:PREDICTED: neurotrypsin-like, partial [Amphimedon queenslandica]|uniref:SRCR domain-containing protein n=1 Tax=Amphimedon queenslandica TaxID=400682 RepID=A0AAN0JYM1_AMPQE
SGITVHPNSSLPYSFSCSGDEAHLMSCSRHTHSVCRYPYDTVGVQCSSYGPTDPSLGAVNSSSGRLTVVVGGVRGTVCGRSFNQLSGHVACRQMGFETISSYRLANSSSSYEFPIALTSVSCSGFESDILSCRHTVTGSGSCSHHDDVVLSCSKERPHADGLVRLIPSGSKASSSSRSSSSLVASGRLLISFHGLWMSVCGKFFSRTAADVACKQLNYTRAITYCTNNCTDAPPTDGYVYFAETQCTGREDRLLDCEHEIHNHELCGHEFDVTLSCIKEVTTTTTTRTPSTTTPTNTVAPTVVGVNPSPSSFFLPIPRLLFYSIVGAVSLLALTCCMCLIICLCVCYRKKKKSVSTSWGPHTNGSISTNEQYHIYDYPHFNEAERNGKDWEASYENSKSGAGFSLEEDPPRYDDFKFQRSLDSIGENPYQTETGLYTADGIAVGSNELILDPRLTSSSEL